MRRPVRLLVSCLAPLVVATSATAQDARPDKPAVVQDARTIEAEVAKFVTAFNAGDSVAIASMFTETARIVDDAGATRGRDAIKARFAAYFAAHPKAKIVVRPEEIVFVSPDVALEEGRSIVTPDESGSRPESTRYTAVHVKQGGAWLQSSLREFPGEEPTTPERLKELEWLVGDWVTESHHAMVTTSCKWTPDKHYLVRDFSIVVAGKPAITGTQRIGWDPVARQVRSWVFDSDGGFGEGFWSRVGETWMIKSTGVRKDGTTASATQVITRIGRDHLRWHSLDRTVGGELAPDGDEYTLVRKPPKPGPNK